MPIKSGVRILAIDDSSFKKTDSEALVVGVIGRTNVIEGVLSLKVKVDGNDATKKIINTVKHSHFSDQIRLIVLHGTTLAGLNLVDTIEVNRMLRMPVISIIRRKPDPASMKRAIVSSKLRDSKKRLLLLEKLNKVRKIMRLNGYYIQCSGIENKEFTIFQKDSVYLLRLAHLIANGIANGESKGRF